MPFYADADAFYAVMHKLFERLSVDPAATADFHSKKMVVRIACTQPNVELVLDGRTNPIQASFGPQPGKVDLGLTMTCDLLHGILMGTQSLKAAFLDGQLKVTGNVFRALQLAGLFRKIEALYPTLLQELGYL